MPSFNHCIVKLSLGQKLPIAELKSLAAEYEADGMTAESAFARAVEDKLQLAKMEEQSIVKAVRDAWEAKGGQVKQAPAAAPMEPAQSAEPKPAPAGKAPAPTIKKASGGQRARQRLQAENPFLAFLASHGIALAEKSDTGMERGRLGNPLVPGYGPLFRRTGLRLDELAEAARDAGFLTQHDIDADTDTGGTRKLADMIQRAVQAKEVFRHAADAGQALPGADDALFAEAHQLGIDVQGKSADQVYDEVVAAHAALEAHREAIGTGSIDEQDQVERFADDFTPAEVQLAGMLDDIPLDGGMSSDNLTDEDIDAIFGIQAAKGPGADGGQAQEGAASDAAQGAQRAAPAREVTDPASLTAEERKDDPYTKDLFGGQDLFDNIEVRPGTLEAQKEAGRAAVSDLARRLGIDRISRRNPTAGSGVSVLGARLLANFVAGKPNQLVGQTARTSHDLAALAQVYRDPRFETFRVFYMRGDEIVGEAGYTSRLPASVTLPPDMLDQIRADKKRFQAAGFYILHNHPSGHAEPSEADEHMTYKIDAEVSGFRGHVVIDHNEYAVIQNWGSEVHQAPHLNGKNFSAIPEMEHKLLGMRLTSPDLVARAAKALQVPDGHATLILTTAPGQVQMLVDLPMGSLDPLRKVGDAISVRNAKALVRRMARETGSGGHRFIVLPNNADTDGLERLLGTGLVTDIVKANGTSMQAMGAYWSGNFLDKNPKSLRVGEPEAPQATPEQSDAYAKALAENRKRAALRILHDAAGIKDVDATFDRGGLHTPAGPEDGSPLYDLARNGTYPEDVYSHNGLRYYSTGEDKMDAEAYDIVKKHEAHPNMMVTIYRAVEKDGPKKILPGDWVTTVRQYAKDHGEANVPGEYKIISARVYARDIFTSGDSWLEWGYHPQAFKPEIPKGEAKAKPLQSRLDAIAARDSAAEPQQEYGSDTLHANTTRTIEVDGVRRPITDSNGKLVGQDFASQKAFWKWFGSSKAVDEHGRPLVVYHGTNSDFDRFDGLEITGWFTEDPEHAATYAQQAAGMASDEGGELGPNVMPTYVSIRKPLTLSFDMNEEMTGRAVYEKAGLEPSDTWGMDQIDQAWLTVNNITFEKAARAAGYDGIKVVEKDHTTWAIFKPEQVKSATGNAGTFDPDSADITAKAGVSTLSSMDASVAGLVREGTTVAKVLEHIAANSANPDYRALAKALQAQNLKTGILYGAPTSGTYAAGVDASQATASYNAATDTARIHQVDGAEQNVLHELVHAATLRALARGGLAAQQIKSLWAHVKNLPNFANEYGIANAEEFVAEAYTNPRFARMLADTPAPGTPKLSLWQKLAGIVRMLLGKPPVADNVLARVMAAQNGLFAENRGESPEGGLHASADGSPKPLTEKQFRRQYLQHIDVQGRDGTAAGKVGKIREEGFANSRNVNTLPISSRDDDPVGMMRQYAPRKGDVVYLVPKEWQVKGPNGTKIREGWKPQPWEVVTADENRPEVYELYRKAFAAAHGQPEPSFARPVGPHDVLAAGDRLRDAAGNYFDVVRQDGARLDVRPVSEYLPADYAQHAWLDRDAPAPQGYWERPLYRADDRLASVAGQDSGQLRASINRALGGAVDRLENVRLPANYLVGDFLNQTGKISWWHKTIGTMDNLARRHPAFAPVYDAVQRFIGDVSRHAVAAADQAPTLLPKLDSIRDVLGKDRKHAVSAADTKAIAAPIFEGTLSWARDANGKPVKVADLEGQARNMTTLQKAKVLLQQGVIDDQQHQAWQGQPESQYDAIIGNKYAASQLKPGVVWSDAELRSMFHLNDHQIGLYREFRKATDESLTRLSISEMVKLGGKEAKPLFEQAVNAGSLDAAATLLRDHFVQQARENSDEADMHNDTATQIMNAADKAKDLIERGYAPLSRFGKYTVYVEQNGEQLYFGMFENKAEAARMARQMRLENPDAQVLHGTVSEEAYKLFAGISPETIELFGSMVGLDENADPAAQEVYQAYLKLAKNNRSAMKRLIHRKGIAGFSEDAARVLSSFIYSNARLTSSNSHMGEIDEAVKAIPKQQGELTDAAVQLREQIRNPQNGHQLGGLMFAQFLGGSVASAMVNMTQPLAMTLPYLSQFGGAGKAASRLMAAYRDAAKKTTGDAGLDAALKWAADEGIVAPQEIHYLQALSKGRGALRAGDGTAAGNARAALNNAMSKVQLGWGKLFALAELANRRVTFIAAYRTAVEEGKPNPAKFAEDAVTQTQGMYNAGNRPRWARNPVGNLLMTFKQYSIAYLELFSRMAFAGEPGSPERAAGQRAALLMMGVLFMLGGADGLPFEQDLEDAIDGILQRLGYNFSTKRAKQKFLVDAIGQGGADFALKGISSMPGMPIDVAGRFGMGNLIPATGLLTRKEDHTRDLGELAGPAGDIAKRAFTGAGKLLGGDVGGAALDLAPQAVRNIAKGADMLETGSYNDARSYKVNDATPAEAVLKMVGFQPNSTADVQDAKGQALNMLAQTRMRSKEIAEHWAQGMASNDPAMVQQARDWLHDWNEKNPDTPIKVSMPGIIKRVRAMREDAQARTQKTAPKALKQIVQRELSETRS